MKIELILLTLFFINYSIKNTDNIFEDLIFLVGGKYEFIGKYYLDNMWRIN